jgi:YesN/AraC family two-component response regulator
MSDGFLGNMAAELSGTLFSALLSENRKKEGTPMYLSFTTGDKKYINNIIENLLFELTKDSPDVSIMTKALSLLLQYLSAESNELLLLGTSVADKVSNRRLEIISYIKSCYRTASLEELSDKLYLTPPYLSKLIKEYFGKSFKELVVDERMSKARELLLGTSMPVSDIIRSVGYENESYFHREFKNREGRTPLSLRRAIKNNLP